VWSLHLGGRFVGFVVRVIVPNVGIWGYGAICRAVRCGGLDRRSGVLGGGETLRCGTPLFSGWIGVGGTWCASAGGLGVASIARSGYLRHLERQIRPARCF
jgi:hypothetical protein